MVREIEIFIDLVTRLSKVLVLPIYTIKILKIYNNAISFFFYFFLELRHSYLELDASCKVVQNCKRGHVIISYRF